MILKFLIICCHSALSLTRYYGKMSIVKIFEDTLREDKNVIAFMLEKTDVEKA